MRDTNGLTVRELARRAGISHTQIGRIESGEPVQARAELARLLAIADFVFEAPDWLASRARQQAPMYAVIADVVLPLQPGRDGVSLVAVTCLTRGGLSDHARRRRNAKRSRRSNPVRSRRPAAPLPVNWIEDSIS